MPAEWYYTTNKQQMGPVSWAELRELAQRGLLKPHDLVWTEGMAEWVKAVQEEGLFSEGGIEVVVTSDKRADYAAPRPAPKRRPREEREVDEDDGEEAARERKRRTRKR